MAKWRWSFLGGITILTLFFGIIGIYLYNIPNQQMEQGQWVTHTYEVLNQLEILSGQLGIAREQENNQAEERVLQTLTTIANLTKDNPNQQERIMPLRQLIDDVFKHSSLNTNQSFPASASLNKNEMSAIAQNISTMRQEEERLLTERDARWQASMEHTRILFISGFAILYLFIIFTYIAFRMESRAREMLLKMESETATMHRGIAARMTQIVDIQQDIISQRLNLENAMKVIAERTQFITHADGAAIEMLEGDEMVYRAVSGSMERFIGFRIKALGSLSGLCVAQAMPLYCADSDTDNRVDKEACRTVNLRSMIVVPLIQQGETIGVLKVASSKPSAFTEEDSSTLQLMAGVLTATLRDALASAALRDSHTNLSMSNELLKMQKGQLESEKDTLKTLADTDGMTGLKNHRYFQEYLAQEYLRAVRYKNELSLILLDIDYFKQFNDEFGHLAGDEVIKQVATLLKNTARASDCVARYGGEEFAVILPQTPMEGALKAAELIRKVILEASWKNRPITVSIGVSSLKKDTTDAVSIIDEADKALYQSKTSGRDKVTAFAA